jgi:hypothetical protein
MVREVIGYLLVLGLGAGAGHHVSEQFVEASLHLDIIN